MKIVIPFSFGKHDEEKSTMKRNVSQNDENVPMEKTLFARLCTALGIQR